MILSLDRAGLDLEHDYAVWQSAHAGDTRTVASSSFASFKRRERR